MRYPSPPLRRSSRARTKRSQRRPDYACRRAAAEEERRRRRGEAAAGAGSRRAHCWRGRIGSLVARELVKTFLTLAGGRIGLGVSGTLILGSSCPVHTEEPIVCWSGAGFSLRPSPQASGCLR